MIMKNVKIPVIIVLVILTMFATDVFSQSGYQQYEDYKIRGTIRDALTKDPIYATLVFESIPDASDVYIIKTEKDHGLYELEIRDNNKYIIEITSDNYKPEIDTVTIAGNISGLDFELLSVKPGQLLRLHNIYFEQGDHIILENSYQEINEIVMLLKQYPDMVIQLEGHTDRQGGRSANLKLSEDRVLEIKKFLVGAGIHPKRIRTAAFGDRRPISTENDEEARRLNRRVEVRIISI
jgi:outer membrane protein OmpA-like peptidoglycan-associated protein